MKVEKSNIFDSRADEERALIEVNQEKIIQENNTQHLTTPYYKE